MTTDLLYTMLACIIMVMLTVLVHYEGLRLISDKLIPRLHMHPRPQMMFVIFGVFLAHTVEVWMFTFCFLVMERDFGLGQFLGLTHHTLIDYMYFSVVTYTSLGIGDVYPEGGLRLLTGVEALTGLLMIGWSASFTYLVMERFWRLHSERNASHRRRHDDHPRASTLHHEKDRD